MIYAWLLVGSFIAVSGGLLIAAISGRDELEEMRGLTDAGAPPSGAGGGGLSETPSDRAATVVAMPSKGRP